MSSFGSIKVIDSNVTIDRLGLGCARLFGGHETRQSIGLIEHALMRGITHFDTAPSYAYGQSEGVLGSALLGHTEITITTKVGIEPSGRPSKAQSLYRKYLRAQLGRFPMLKSKLVGLISQDFSQSTNSPSKRRLTRQHIEASVERSLKALKRSKIDLLLVHEPDQFFIDSELDEYLKTLQMSGVIGSYGLGYGRQADEAESFGQVLQHTFAGHACSKPDRTQICHGLMRLGASLGRSPSELIGNTLTSSQNLSLLLSASSKSQIDQWFKSSDVG